MSQLNSIDKTIDPVDALNECLELTWTTLCNTYDASGNLPNIVVLFDKVNLSNPDQAAQGVLVNMLLEVIEGICRFSPWYSKSARIFGLTSMRDPVTNLIKWVLAPEALEMWRYLIDPLSKLILNYSGLIKALLLGESWGGVLDDDPEVTACCGCIPPRVIQLKRSVLMKERIVCDRCMQTYS